MYTQQCLDILETLAQTLENLTELLHSIREDEKAQAEQADCCMQDSVNSLPLDLQNFLNGIRESEEREEDQEERLSNMERLMGLDKIKVPDDIGEMTNEQAEIAGIQAGLEAAFKAVFGPDFKISRIYP